MPSGISGLARASVWGCHPCTCHAPAAKLRALNTTPLHCAHCGAPLDALTRRRGRGHCDRAACRARADADDLGRRWQQVGRQAQQLAAQQPETGALPALLLQLESTGRRLVPVTEADRSFLAARWRAAWATCAELPVDGADSATDTPADAAALCGHCAGRCCTHGAAHAAFIDAAVLRRWLAAHPGATLDEAIAAHMDWLPSAHVEGQCAYQTAHGCALPRERRADICNVYRCPALATLATQVALQPDTAAVVLTRDGRRLQQAVVFRRGRATPLAGVPQPDDLPA